MNAGHNHTIPDEVAKRVAALVNAAQDMRDQASDDLKQIYADLREELSGLGWTGATISAEIAAFKGAISELRLDDEKRTKRDDKSDRVESYVALLSRARARVRTRENIEEFPPRDAETGEITEQQESEPIEGVRTNVVNELVAGTSETGASRPAGSLSDEIPSANPDDFDPSKLAFQRKIPADYRPHCQHPDNCGASGLTHCYACRKLIEMAEE